MFLINQILTFYLLFHIVLNKIITFDKKLKYENQVLNSFIFYSV